MRLFKRSAIVCYVVLLMSVPAITQPTKQPVLRLNTQMHTGTIRRISSDTQGKIVLTCSDDKTAILWDAATGRLLRILRPPIDAGNEGMLFSCALSPDGTIAVVGGWTGYLWNRTHNIYIFNTSTGEMLQRISGMENVIDDLKFSSDGDYFAAALGAGAGVCILEKTQTGFALFTKLTDYGSDCYNVAFDVTGRLATVCYDGYLRLYDRQFNLIEKIETSGGKQPFSLAFSPDGDKIAVGYEDSPVIEVYDGFSLQLHYKPDVTGVQKVNGGVDVVSFSHDGDYLFGGGSYPLFNNGVWKFTIRRWSQSGKGTYVDFPVCYNRVLDIRPLPDNSILFCGAYPDCGKMEPTGEMVFYQSAETNDFAAKDETHLKVNHTGTIVGFTPRGSAAQTFSIDLKLLSEKKAEYPSYTDHLDDIQITDWYVTTSPKLNGSTLSFLKQNERSFAVDISDDHQSIVFGASWNLYCLDKNGASKWKTPTQATVWTVNIAGDGRSVITACGDGTLRWYRMSDGALLLTLFIHSDLKRWVLWTPNGYYDATPGGEDLIGWHINNGEDHQADFYPASRLRTTYYRPDVISNVLQTLDEDEALKLANEESGRRQQAVTLETTLPPVVRITSPEDGTEVNNSPVTVHYALRSPSGETITGLKVLVDGRPVNTNRGMKIVNKETEGEVSVSIPHQDCEVSLIAENRFASSVQATIRLRWKGKIAEEFIIKPKLYVLAVGVSKYRDQDLRLQLAAKDALDFANAVKKQKGFLYRDIVVKVLTDEQATKGEILDGLEWIQHETTSKDIAMILLTGHGVIDNSGNFYFLPVDVETQRLKRTGLSVADIKSTGESIAGKTILFLDACHSGNIMGGRKGVADLTEVINELSSAENGLVVFTSSTGKQYSLERSDWGNGAFTKALVEGINGKADVNRTGRITINMLDLYISERVKELTNGEQTPTTSKPPNIPDFPVVLMK